MARRKWNQPVVENEQSIVQMPDGSMRQGVTIGLCAEDHEMIREGYKCAWCLQVFESAWPDVCSFCGVPKGEWMAWYEQSYAGEKWYGPNETSADRRERLREELAWRNKLAERNVWLPDMVTPGQVQAYAIRAAKEGRIENAGSEDLRSQG